MHTMLRKSLLAIGLCLVSLLLSPAVFAETYHWIQYGTNGLEARAITDQSNCPRASIDGAEKAMSIRAAADPQYPVIVCTIPVPPHSARVAISGTPVNLPPPIPTRIAIIGDTGCRLKGPYVQACNDPTQWPFRLIAEVVAQLKPDLVIHVGDYHYRETQCPDGNLGCAGSPFGDNWDVWRADFFAPADTLLKTAPWVFVRGNHEECDRGGKGWSRALEPYAFDSEHGCNGTGKPVIVSVPGLTLAVMDVASAQEDRVNEEQARAYREQYKSLAELTNGPTWILQHRPIWSPGGVFGGKLVGDNKTLADAARTTLPGNVSLFLSGHHHLFQVLTYQSDLPLQIVSGHGGDFLNQGTLPPPNGWTINGMTVASGLSTIGMFGFSLMERQSESWQLTNFNRLGMALSSCVIKGRLATCH
jgi:hypothetical protein